MKRVKRIALLAPLLTPLLCLTPTAARAPQRQAADGDEVVRISSDLVVLDALVLDKKKGRPIGGLRAEDFELYEDGVRQEIGYFGQSELPLSIMFLLDVSGSVRPILASISEGALDALRQLKPHDEVAVMAFANRTQLVQGFTRDRRLVAEKIREASWADRLGSGTFLNEALYEAAGYMPGASNPASRRVIIVVTDNIAPPAKGRTAERALGDLAESGTVVYGLIVRGGLGKALNVMTLGLLHAVDSYADETGGEVIGAGKKEVEEKLASVIAHLRARYNLGYRPTNASEDGRPRRIRLQLSRAAAEAAARRKEKPYVRTRQSYYFRRRASSVQTRASESADGRRPRVEQERRRFQTSL